MAKRDAWTVNVKCNAEEEEALKRAASYAGLEPTTWARSILLANARDDATVEFRFNRALVSVFARIRAAGVEDGHLADQAGHSVEMSREWYSRSTVEQRAAVADAAARRFATGLLPTGSRRAATGVRTAKKSGRKSARTKG